MDECLHTIERISGVLQSSFSGRFSDVRRLRNAFVPISQLPNEVFVHILRLSIDLEHAFKYEEQYEFYNRRQTLALVSSSWWTCINQTPYFWTIYTPYLTKSAFEGSIDKSERSSLHIVADKSLREEAIADFWIRIGPYLDRCSRIKAQIPSTTLSTISSGAPLLEELDIRPTEVDTKFLPTETNLGFSSLKTLRLRAFSMPWTKILLLNLTDIELEDVTGLSLTILLDLLKTCPSLATLVLSSVQIINGDQIQAARHISLKVLRTLVVCGLGQVVTQALLETLRPTALQKFRIQPSNKVILDYTTIHYSYQQSVISTITESFQIFYFETLSIKSGTTYDSVVWLGGLDTQGLKFWLEILHRSNRVTPSRLCVGYDLPDAKELLAVADPYQSITHLELLFQSPTSCFNFLDAFCNLNDKSAWPLPNVSSISLHRWKPYNYTSMGNFLKRRYGAPNCPTPLTLLTYEWGCALPELSDMVQNIERLSKCKVIRKWGSVVYLERDT
jgi:hypothetical protein